MNKRGDLGNQITGFAFFFFMVIIGVGIAFGVYRFFGSGYDFREAEAELLNYKIRQCIMEKEVKEDFFALENFFKICNLDKGVIEKNNLIRICENSNDCIREDKGILNPEVGENFQTCKLEGGRENSAFPRCVIRELSKEDRKFEIITGSRQFSRRIQG